MRLWPIHAQVSTWCPGGLPDAQSLLQSDASGVQISRNWIRGHVRYEASYSVLPNYPPGSTWRSSHTLANAHSFLILTVFINASVFLKMCHSLMTSETEYTDDDLDSLLSSSLYPRSLPIHVRMCSSVYVFIIYTSPFCIRDINFLTMFICLSLML